MKEEERILYEAVEKLPPKQKTVLILYYYNDMPIREIARVCGVFEGTVKSRLFHAKEQLKQILTQEEGGKTWTIREQTAAPELRDGENGAGLWTGTLWRKSWTSTA